MRRPTVLLAASVVVAGVAGLAVINQGDGRDLREPPPGATTSSAPPPTTTTTGASVGPVAFGLTISEWNDGGSIPIEHTCDGDGFPPEISWQGLPEGTAEVALVMVDPDASGFVHWAVAGIDPATTGIDLLGGPDGEVPGGAVQGRNSAGQTGWTEVCPPPGEEHTYVVTLYALGKPSGLTDGFDPADGVRNFEAEALATASYLGRYQRQG